MRFFSRILSLVLIALVPWRQLLGLPSKNIIAVRLPFLANEGQVQDQTVKFVARTFGGLVAVHDDGSITYRLPRYEPATGPVAEMRRPSGGHVFRESFADARRASVQGAEKQATQISVFKGSDPSAWRVGVAAYNAVDVGEIYAGINLRLRACENNVEKIFTVAPGADPSCIHVRLEGVESAKALPDGRLELSTPLGPVSFSAPVAFQERNGARAPVKVAYLPTAGGYGFELGEYDKTRPLVIDPLLASTFIGGSGDDVGNAIASDTDGNIYVAGYTASLDFPVKDSCGLTNAGMQDAFVSKFDYNLSTLIAGAFLGGGNDDAALAIAITNNMVVVAGCSDSDDYPVTTYAYALTNSGGRDAVVSVLNYDLTSLDYSTYFGGSANDTAFAVGVDNQFYIHIAGKTESYNLPTTPNAFQGALKGQSDAFAARFTRNLQTLASSSFIGGDSNDVAHALCLQPKAVILAGQTWSTNFPVATNGFSQALNGLSDAFVVRMPLELTHVLNGTFIGGNSDEAAYSIVTDEGARITAAGNSTIVTSLYFTGFTVSTNFPTNNIYTPGPTISTKLSGPQDAFLVRMPVNCTNIFAGTYIGGSGTEAGRAVVLHPTGRYSNDVIVIGQTDSTDLPTTPASYDVTPNGGKDGFLMRLQPRLTNLVAGTYLGGGADDNINAATLLGNTIYLAGSTKSVDFPVSDNAYEVVHFGSNDVFVSRIGAPLASGTLRWSAEVFGFCSPPAMDLQGNIYVVGLEGQNGFLYSFSPEGKTNWSRYVNAYLQYEASAYGSQLCPVVDMAGNVYLAGGGISRIYGFRGATGEEFLNYYLGDGHHVQQALALTIETNLIIGSHGFGVPGTLFSISPSGALNWQTNLPSGGATRSSASIASDGRIFLGTEGTGLLAYAASGEFLWSKTNQLAMNSSPAIGTNGFVYIGGGSGHMYEYDLASSGIYTGKTGVAAINGSPLITTNNFIVALTATNLLVFSNNFTSLTNFFVSTTLSNNPYMSPALGIEGSIFAPCSNMVGASGYGGLNALKPSGNSYITNWTFVAPGAGPHMSSPALALDGTVYVGGKSNLYALFGNEPLAHSAWPMAHHDALRTGNQGMSFIPGPPLNVAATKGEPADRVCVTWDFSLNASRYELYKGTNAGIGFVTNLLLSTRGNIFYDSDVIPGKKYFYRVLAKNAYGKSVLSAADYGGIPPLPPAAVRATKGVPFDRINVSWGLADYALNYELWRSTNALPAFATNLLTTAGTNFVDNDIVLGVKYYYFAVASNEFGRSAFSEPDYGGTAPQAFAPTAGAGVSLDNIPVSWQFSPGALAFELYRSAFDIPATALKIATLPGTNYVDEDIVPSNVVPCRVYYYWIKTTNEFGTSAFSQSGSGFRSLYPPGSFVVSAGGVYTTKVHTAWTPVPYGQSYEIYRGTSSVFSAATLLNRVGGFEYNDTSVTRGGCYYYWIRARNDFGASVWVGPGMGGTPPVAPSGMTATEGVYTDRILLNWQGVYGAAMYQLFRGSSIDSVYATLLTNTTVLSYEDRSILPGQRYYYWARATNIFGNSSFSASDSGYVLLSPPDGLVASDGAYTNNVRVMWNEAPGATTYEVWRNTANNTNTAVRLVYTSERFYDDTLVTPGALYYYWIRAKTESFSSSLSQPDTGFAASGLADLEVHDFVFLPTRMGLFTTPDAVSFRLKNKGPQPLFGANTRVSMDVYVSANSVFGDADDEWFGHTSQDVDLPVNGEVNISLTANQRLSLEIPYLDTGSYYIFMIVRHAYPSSYLDPDLNNNIARRAAPTAIHSFAPSVYAGVNDYNGDGIADLAVYDRNTGRWFIRAVAGEILAWGEPWGGPGMVPVLGDFDSDRKADLAVYDTASGLWYIRRLDGSIIAWALPWGGPGMMPVWGDFDGDGTVDLAVYESATGNWFVRTIAGALLGWGMPWGGAGFVPVMGDYNGDGRQDLAVYQSSTWSWFIRTLSGSVLLWAEQWGGTTGFIPVPGDFDGDGVADLAVYHASTGYWFIKRVDGDVIVWGDYWGGAGLYPVPGDFDGDGRSDLAVFCPDLGTWHIRAVSGEIIAWALPWGGGAIRPVGMGD